MRLRQLEPDRTAADHDQVCWRLLEIEDRLIGKKGHVSQAGDRRHERRRARRDHEAARLDLVAAR